MKILLVLVFVLFYCLLGYAQTEFAPIGAEWYYSYTEGAQSPETGYYTLKSIKDTVIDSKVCKILSRTLVNSKGNHFNDGQSIVYHNPVENKIYRYLFNRFYLLYDFTKTVGDTIIIKEPYSVSSYDSIVTVVDSVGIEILPNNIQLKSFYIRSIEGSKFDFDGKTIEKIGNLLFLFPFNQLDCDGGCPLPLRCYNDNQINFVSHEPYVLQVPCDFVYTNTNLIKSSEVSIYPNPFTNSFTIKNGNNDETNLSIDIFNLYGRPMLHDVIPGNEDHMINFKEYPCGLYFLRIKIGDKISTFKIIKNSNLP